MGAKREATLNGNDLFHSVQKLLRIRSMCAVETRDVKNISIDLVFIVFLRTEGGQPLYVKQLVAEAGGSPTAVLRKIENLESAGLLRRIPDESDGRRVRLVLTPRARSLVSSMVVELTRALPA